MEYQLKTYYNKENLPEMEDVSFFHYTSGFDWYKDISHYKPLMIVAFDGEKPVACMFALVMRINRFLYGSVFKRCYVSQQPAFFDENIPQDELFYAFVEKLLQEVKRQVFYIQFRHLGNPIFGYKAFREHHFYSIKWINICNSLQRKRKIWDQLSSTRKNQINKAIRKGVITTEFTSEEMLADLYKYIERQKDWRITDRFPPYQYFDNFFRYYIREGKGKILLCKHKNKIIGGVILGFEESTVYCLYYWGNQHIYKNLHPSIFSIWSAMDFAEKGGYTHFDFMDSGFFHEKAGKTRFLLQFGGKQKATRRWHRFNWPLINFFAKKIYD